MKISFGAWAFVFGPYAASPVSVIDVARQLSVLGYDGIEIDGFPPHVTLETYPGKSSRIALRKRLEDLRLEVSAYAADFTSVNPLQPENSTEWLDLFRRNLDLCLDLGTTRIRVDTVAAPGSILDEEQRAALERLADLWREAAELASKAGVRIVWEFEPGFLFNKPSEIVELYEQVGHANFQILFDTCHAYLCGVAGARQTDPVETVESVGDLLDTFSGRIGHLHLVDSDGTLYGDETSSHLPLGSGVIDFAELKPKLHMPGVDWWCLDLSFLPGAWDMLGPSLKYARNLASDMKQTR